MKLVHGGVYWVVRTERKHTFEPELAQYNHWETDPADDDPYCYWTYFGSDWTDTVQSGVVEVLESVVIPPVGHGSTTAHDATT